ncbi:MAG: SprT-like domain-containing protein [Cyclobacteriaceae bacterium]
MTSREVFEKFVPPEAVSYCNKLYERLEFEFKVKKARQTKLGDYRFDPYSEKHTITINNDLNAYSFLVTYLHEVAHLIAFKRFGNRVQPHGREWKQSFREVAEPMLSDKVFDPRVLNALKRYFNNPKASSCSDPVLYNLLKQFDGKDVPQLKDIAIGEVFIFNKRTFRKLEKKRTRSICLELKTNRKYTIAEIAEVSI